MVGKAGQQKKAPAKVSSRDNYKCPVPECQFNGRRDNVRLHIDKLVITTQGGIDPIDPKSQQFHKLSDASKHHTRYFFQSNFTREVSNAELFGHISLPKEPTQLLTPHDMWNFLYKKKRKSPSGDEATSSKVLIELYLHYHVLL